MAAQITSEWLTSLGVFRSVDVTANVEHEVRIRGGDDDGSKTSSDQDRTGDEISVLVIAPEAGGGTAADCYVESYLNSEGLPLESITYLGKRETREEIIELCRALKAWGVKYPS